MGVDVVDVIWFETSVVKGPLHCMASAAAFGVGCGDVPGVTGVGRSDKLCVDCCAASLGVLK